MPTPTVVAPVPDSPPPLWGLLRPVVAPSTNHSAPSPATSSVASVSVSVVSAPDSEGSCSARTSVRARGLSRYVLCSCALYMRERTLPGSLDLNVRGMDRPSQFLCMRPLVPKVVTEVLRSIFESNVGTRSTPSSSTCLRISFTSSFFILFVSYVHRWLPSLSHRRCGRSAAQTTSNTRSGRFSSLTKRWVFSTTSVYTIYPDPFFFFFFQNAILHTRPKTSDMFFVGLACSVLCSFFFLLSLSPLYRAYPQIPHR